MAEAVTPVNTEQAESSRSSRSFWHIAGIAGAGAVLLAGSAVAGAAYERYTQPDGVGVETSVDGSTIHFSFLRRWSTHNGAPTLGGTDVLLSGTVDCSWGRNHAVSPVTITEPKDQEHMLYIHGISQPQYTQFISEMSGACGGSEYPDGWSVPARIFSAGVETGVYDALQRG
jgi:hypothetical protein